MAENASNVYVAKPKVGGAVWSAPLGTAVPTNATAALSSEFKCLGYISEDGITTQPETDTEDIKAYGGDVVRTVQTSYKETYKFAPIETNRYVFAETWGEENVTVDTNGNIAIVHNSKVKPARIYVIETLLEENKVQRDVIPRGRVTEIGEKKYSESEAIGSELTISCENDASGNSSYTYVATTLTPTDISLATIADIPDQTHTGSPITPTLTVTKDGTTLVLNTDYTVAYSNNTDVGTATATITGIGAYTGTKSKNFTIKS